eukprot:403348434
MIKCLECDVLIQNIDNPAQLPINLALLQFSKNQLQSNAGTGMNNKNDSPKRQKFEDIAIEKIPKRHRIQSGFNHGSQVSLCETHDKKIEAFCDLDKKLLCIDCILNENHKNHEILALEKACTKEKFIFDMSLKTALQKEAEVHHQIFRIRNYLNELEDSANKNRSEISKIFNEIRNKIIDRETNMKKQISDTLEREQHTLKQKIVYLEDQMKCIQDLKDEKIMIENETVLETLIQSPFRQEIENDANRKVDILSFAQVFSEIKKDEEIANIVRAIIPQHLRTTLLSNTVSSQIKKKEKQDEAKRREFSKQPNLPVYDYDHKFNYRKGYLREDKVPAFISTKQNQISKKEAELVNNSTDIIIESKAMIGLVQKQTSMGATTKNHIQANQQLHINSKQTNQRHTMNGLGSNDNSPRTQQQIIQNQIQRHGTLNQQSVGGGVGSIQNANQKLLRKQQTTTGNRQQKQDLQQNPFDQSHGNESSVVNQQSNNLRPSAILPQSIHQNLQNEQIKRAASQDRHANQFQCTLPQSIQTRRDSPRQVKKYSSDMNTDRNMTPKDLLNHQLQQNELNPNINLNKLENRKSQTNTPQKQSSSNKTGTNQWQQQQQLNQIYGSFDNKIRSIQKQQQQTNNNELYQHQKISQAPQTHRQASKTSNLADARSQKKQEKAKSKVSAQLQNHQVFFGLNMQHQSSVMSNQNNTSQANQSNMSTLKKKSKKPKDSSYFEFTNEKLFKQITEKKNPVNTSKLSKTNKSVSKNVQPKTQKKPGSQIQGSLVIQQQNQQKSHTESSDQSQNQNSSNKDIERQKSSQDDDMREQLYEESSSSHHDDFEDEQHNKIDDEFSENTNKKRKNVYHKKNKYMNSQGNADDEDQNEEEGQFEEGDDQEDPVHHKLSNYQDRSHGQSEDMDEEGIPEISSIHQSPQKRHSEVAGVITNIRTIAKESTFAKVDHDKKNKDKNHQKLALPDNHNIPSASQFQTRKLEDHFDNDQSRINFMPDQNTINDGDFKFDFDMTINRNNGDNEAMVIIEDRGVNDDNSMSMSILNQFKNSALDNNAQIKDNFDTLFKMKEEYIFVFSGFNERFLTSVEVFDVTRGIWREFKDSCPNRAKFQVQALNEETILIFGGKDEFGIQMDDVEDFGIKEMKAFPGDWRLPQNISGFGSCLIKPGVIAICGGNTGQTVSNKFFMLAYKSIKSTIDRNIDQQSQNIPQITEMPSMIQPREEFALVLGPDQKLYAIGGYNPQDGCISSVEAFDFDKQQWEIVTQMEEGKRALNAVALPDGIYVLGGYNGKEYLNTVQKYDLMTHKWQSMRGMNTSRGTFSALAAQNCNYIYAIGGFNGQPLDHVERFDAIKNQWEYLAPMKQKRFMHAACIANIEEKKK